MQSVYRTPLLGLAALAALGGAAAEGEGSDGAALYHDYCSVCHGDRGDGDSRARRSMVPPPRDFTEPSAAVELTRERMIASVTAGRPGTAMAGWSTQLDPAQIEAVVGYIRERFMSPVATEDAAAGRRLYAENCSVCHGDDGRGARWAVSNMNPPPRDFTGPSARAELDRERMLRAVTHGRPDTAMAGFAGQLDPAQIEAVVDYIRAAFIDAPETAESRAPAAEPAPHGDYMAMPMPGGMTANPDRGEALYRVNCTACHGEAGDGRGPRAYFIIPKPRNFTQPAARQTLNRPTLFEAIANGRVGTEMPAWKQVLSPQDIADLAEYVFRSFIHGGELAQRDST